LIFFISPSPGVIKVIYLLATIIENDANAVDVLRLSEGPIFKTAFKEVLRKILGK